MRWLLILQVTIFFHAFLSIPWIVLHIIGLRLKYSTLSLTYQFLSVTGYMAAFILEYPRLFVGYLGNMLQRPALIMGFWLITALITLPVQAFLLFSPGTKSIPLEIVVDSIILIFLSVEVISGVFSVRKAIQAAVREGRMNSGSLRRRSPRVSSSSVQLGEKTVQGEETKVKNE